MEQTNVILEQGAPNLIKRGMEQWKILKRSMEQEHKWRRSREHRKMKKEQGKSEKRAKGKKLKGAGSKRRNCERSREHGPPLTEALFCFALLGRIKGVSAWSETPLNKKSFRTFQIMTISHLIPHLIKLCVFYRHLSFIIVQYINIDSFYQINFCQICSPLLLFIPPAKGSTYSR